MTTELIEPELLEQTEGEDGRKMASEQHGSISALLLIYLGSFVLQHKLGRTLDSSTTYDFSGWSAQTDARRIFCRADKKCQWYVTKMRPLFLIW